MSGIEYKRRRPRPRVRFGDFPPVVVEPVGFRLGLLLFIHEKRGCALCPARQDFPSQDGVGIENQETLAGRPEQGFQLDEAQAPNAPGKISKPDVPVGLKLLRQSGLERASNQELNGASG